VKVADCPSVHLPFEAGRRFESCRGRSFPQHDYFL